jgi:hypothetical protein
MISIRDQILHAHVEFARELFVQLGIALARAAHAGMAGDREGARMSALNLFSRETAEILQFDDDGLLRQVNAVGWRYREFFLRHERNEFTPFHLPTGLGMPFYFTVIDAAASFVVDVDRLRNDWRDLTPDDWQALKDSIIGFALRHGAEVAGFRKADKVLFRSRLNGYGGTA